MTIAEQIEQVLSNHDLVLRAIEIEPQIMGVFEMAARGPYYGYNRWYDYDRLKGYLYPLVGWGAQNPDLCSERLWFACMTVLDHLLPEDPALIDVTPAQIEVQQ